MPGTPATTPNFGFPRYDNATDAANFALQVNAITDHLDTVLDSIFPVGSTLDWQSEAEPPTLGTIQYLEQIGQTVTATEYPKLAARWGKTGSFLIPDRRGRVPAGAGTGPSLTARTVGQQFGTETHALTEAQMPSHGHSASQAAHTHTDPQAWKPSNTGSEVAYTRPDNVFGGAGMVVAAGTTGSAQPAITVASTGGNQAHPITQPTIVTRYFVRVA